MTLHVVAFQDAVAAAALAAKVPAADETVTIAGVNIIVPALSKLLAVYACSAALVQVQLQSPTLRRIALYDLAQFDFALFPADHTFYKPFFKTPVALTPGEGLQAWALSPGALVQSIVAILGDGAPAPVTGEVFSVAFAGGAVGTVIGTWVNSPIALAQVLPVGRYQLVGAHVETPALPDLIAFRFVAPGGGARPGGIALNTPNIAGCDEQRFGNTGVWLEFDSAAPPTIDILAGTAAAHTPVGWLDLIKIG